MLTEYISPEILRAAGNWVWVVAVVWAVFDYLKLKLIMKGTEPEDRPKILQAWRRRDKAPLDGE